MDSLFNHNDWFFIYYFFWGCFRTPNNRGPKFKKLAYYFKFISKIPKNFNDILLMEELDLIMLMISIKMSKWDLVEVLMTNQIVCFYY